MREQLEPLDPRLSDREAALVYRLVELAAAKGATATSNRDAELTAR
ncbi:MAG: hypothetical protein ACRDQ2_15190 [Gaiellales bacterium]